MSSETSNYSQTRNATPSQFPRISRPVELLRSSYDVVVIGSGYGGGIAASRMARGRQSVCLLERGHEKWPGEYPVSLADAAKEFHVSGSFAPNDSKGVYVEGGSPTGLYHLVVGEGQNAFVGNGLGGTSLLNANIFLEMDDGVKEMAMWPKELRDKSTWDKYYSRAKKMLEPEPYPADYPEIPKLTLLQKQAELLGQTKNFYRPPQTTRFVDGPNSTGVEMNATTLTGQDATGINDGSKSSTLVNYLSDAWNWGAEMFCGCEVRHIENHPTGEGYIVYFAWHGSRRGQFKDNIYKDLMWVHAKKFVFLGAGSLGTTEILLRSKNMGLSISDSIGHNMSGNGDILAFGYNTDFSSNSMGNPAPSPTNPVGPCITGVIDCRDQENPLNGFVIEEGTVPKALAPLFQFMLESLPGSIAPTGRSTIEKIKSVFARLGSQLIGPYYSKGSIEKTQIYLIMSHDSRSEHAQYLNALLAKATAAVGGTFVQSPFYAALGQQEITVHAIGGARMSNDGTGLSGATNHLGGVFKGHGSDVHEGLIVCDGALVPGALGVNPFATISALAERSIELLAKQRSISIDFDTKNGVLDLFGRPAFPVLDDHTIEPAQSRTSRATINRTNGVEFSEVMSGFIHVAESVPEDFEVAAKIAQSKGEVANCFLSVKTYNTTELTHDPTNTGLLTGTFSHSALHGPFMIHRGSLQLFSVDSQQSDTNDLVYKFSMLNPSGEVLHFQGYKIINNEVTFSPSALWNATTTLYVTITRLVPTGTAVVGRGILHIRLSDFLSEVKTLQTNGGTTLSRIISAWSFASFFARNSLKHFLAPLNPLSYPTPTYSDFINVTPIAATYTLTATDGVHSQLYQYNPDQKYVASGKPVQTILFIPGASVDHQIFALPTIPRNAIDYFTAAGYRCYVVVHRVGKNIAALKGYTSFDARLDVRAAFEQIHAVQNSDHGAEPSKIYVISHCIGALALGMGLLSGSIKKDWIKGITTSQVFLTPKFSGQNVAKVYAPIRLTTLWSLFANSSWFDTRSSSESSLFQRAVDQILRLYPVWIRGGRREFCSSSVCHRGSLIFGRLWCHENLNEATHRQLDRFLGGISMRCLQHLEDMGQETIARLLRHQLLRRIW
ncbi:hypothetical protein FH972_009503 [Carpinus fangiana]|uniref:Glucose-methanol-choline oxidoreductase N-terminal domain-containing protein n=1 Tax=Carpinus fangiana TaxID=176857 RepID=A0A660KME7_9ROSI|nr:hypothetical protein FH972_009503 [Carpinus fangiana]